PLNMELKSKQLAWPFSGEKQFQADDYKKTTQNFLKRFEAIDSTGFSATDQLNKDLMIYQLKDTFSLSVLANPIEASKGDGEMATG
ncbi:hypothetical protein ACTXQV_68505, partial [Klebsiella pneumoniae]